MGVKSRAANFGVAAPSVAGRGLHGQIQPPRRRPAAEDCAPTTTARWMGPSWRVLQDLATAAPGLQQHGLTRP